MNEQMDSPKWTEAPQKFFLEAISGIIIFATIAGAAVLLSFFIKYLDGRGVDQVIIVGLKLAEYAIFFVDLVLFGRFLWITGKNTWRNL